MTRRQYKNLLVIHEVYHQPKWIFDNRESRIADRIVSISQPHVRPIKRGKASAATEFGTKISASLAGGFTFVDRISWDNYNEAGDLNEQIELYHSRFGFYPESAHADKIYRNKDNRKFAKSTVFAFPGRHWEDHPNKSIVKAKRKLARMSWIASQLKVNLVRPSAASVYQRSCANWLKPQRLLLQ